MSAPVTNEDLKAALDKHSADDKAAIGACNESIGALTGEVASLEVAVRELTGQVAATLPEALVIMRQTMEASKSSADSAKQAQGLVDKLVSEKVADLAKRASKTDVVEEQQTEIKVERSKLELERDKALVVVDVEAKKKRSDLAIEAERIDVEAKRERSAQWSKLTGAIVGVLIIAGSILATWAATRAGISPAQIHPSEPALPRGAPSP